MTNWIKTGAVVAAVIAGLASHGFAAQNGKQWQVVVENTWGSDIVGLFGSRASTEYWEDDILNGSVIADGDFLLVDFADGNNECVYDLKVDFADGSTWEEHDVDVCEMTIYTLEPA